MNRNTSRLSADPLVVSVSRTHGYATATCDCGWKGVDNPTRTIEGIHLAQREAHQHAAAHTAGAGFFHYHYGWTPCDPRPAVTA